MKKLGLAGYFCGMEIEEAFEVLRKFKGDIHNSVIFVVKTYVGKKLFAFRKTDYNALKKKVNGESNLVSLIEDMCRTYFLTGAKVVLTESSEAADKLNFRISENHKTNSNFSLGIKEDGSYILIANNWIRLI